MIDVHSAILRLKQSSTYSVSVRCRHFFTNQAYKWLNIQKDQIKEINFICNNIKDNPRHVENFIILAMKKYIYNQRCNQSKPNVIEFKQ